MISYLVHLHIIDLHYQKLWGNILRFSAVSCWLALPFTAICKKALFCISLSLTKIMAA